MNEQLCKCGHYGHRQRDNSCRVTTCDCTSFRPAEAARELVDKAREWFAAHRYDELYRAVAYSGYRHATEAVHNLMADFASEQIAQRTAELEKRVGEQVQSVTLRDGRRIYDASVTASPFEDGWTDGVVRWDSLFDALARLSQG